jgi:predicted nucleic acid-binding protein
LIAYFDTSAFAPLLVEEPGSDAARSMWDQAVRVVCVPLLYAEARGALAQARRMERLGARQQRAAVRLLDELYPQFEVVGVDEALVRHAGEVADAYGVRGYDAVHLAAAHRVADTDLVVVAGDRALLAAAQAIGLAVAAV